VNKEIVVNRTFEEIRIAALEDGKLFDLFIERRKSEKILNNIYKGSVQNIVPALGSAFIDIGFEKNAYLGVDDINVHTKEKNIKNMIKIGQDVMVQVYKESIGTKCPKVTMNISLPGRLLVYIPFSDNIGVSKNISDEKEHDRLKSIITEIKKDTIGGIIARTEAENADDYEIRNEIKYLTRLWSSIVSRFNNTKPMSLIHKDLGVVFQTIRDYFSDNVSSMYIDSPREFRDVIDFVKIVSPELLNKIALYNGSVPIFKAYGIDEEIKKLHSNKIRLQSGGYLIIQEAESLCAIDVNSGKFTAKASQEATATVTNIEATYEIARQLRLRNIGGIIVIDFIDMKKSDNRRKILEKLREATKGDKAKIKICPITKLGLIEMSRQRKRESLFSLLGDTCPVCKGLGIVLSKESIFINICDEVEQLKFGEYRGKIRINLHPDIVDYFKEKKSRLKELFNAEFEIKTSQKIAREEYQIVFE
jgi:ribonuclease G